MYNKFVNNVIIFVILFVLSFSFFNVQGYSEGYFFDSENNSYDIESLINEAELNLKFTVKIPKSVDAFNIEGGNNSEPYDVSDNYWKYRQAAIYSDWVKHGKESKWNIGVFDGLFMLAMTSKFGTTGDIVILYLNDGTAIPCLMADGKGRDAQSEWGHFLGEGSTVDIVEWMYVDGTGDGRSISSFKDERGWKGRIVKVENYGNYKLYDKLSVFSILTAYRTDFENFIFLGDSHINHPEHLRTFSNHNHQVLAGSSGRANQLYDPDFGVDLTKRTVTVGSGEGFLTMRGSLKDREFNGIVLLFGSNDVGFGVDTAYEWSERLIEKLSSTYAVPIYVQRVPPVGKNFIVPSERRSYIEFNRNRNADILELNSKLQEYCELHNNVYFIDTFSDYVDSDGFLSSKYSSDGLHLFVHGKNNKDLWEDWYSKIEDKIKLTGSINLSDDDIFKYFVNDTDENNLLFLGAIDQFNECIDYLIALKDDNDDFNSKNSIKNLIHSDEKKYIIIDNVIEDKEIGYMHKLERLDSNFIEGKDNLSVNENRHLFSDSEIVSILFSRYVNPIKAAYSLNSYFEQIQDNNLEINEDYVNSADIKDIMTFETNRFTASNGGIVDYILYNPHTYDNSIEKMPMILYLVHAGYRQFSVENYLNSTNRSHLVNDIKNEYITPPNAMIVMPFTNGSWKWNEGNVKELLDNLVNEYNIDTNRISITGFSMGGQGVWPFITLYPDYFCAAVSISGDATYVNIDSIMNVNFPVKLIVGGNESGILNGAKGYNVIYNTALKHEKTNFELIKVPNYGHTGMHNIYRNQFENNPNNDSDGYSSYNLFDWLLSQTN